MENQGIIIVKAYKYIKKIEKNHKILSFCKLFLNQTKDYERNGLFFE